MIGEGKEATRRLAWLAGAVLLAVLVPAIALSAPGDQADLKVTKSDSPDPITVGGVLTYTIEVQNAGKRLPMPRSMAMIRVTFARAR